MIKKVSTPNESYLFGNKYIYNDFYDTFLNKNLFCYFRNLQVINYHIYDAITENKPILIVLKKNNLLPKLLQLIIFISFIIIFFS